MKLVKYCSKLSIVIILMSSFFQCSSVQNFQKNAPTTFENVYYQKWNAGIEKGGSGIDIFLEAKAASVVLDSIYFRGRSAKLHINPSKISVHVGRFKSESKQSIDDKIKPSNTPLFNLKNNECVVSYLQNNAVFYFKIDNITEKQTINYPSTPPNSN